MTDEVMTVQNFTEGIGVFMDFSFPASISERQQ